VLAGLAACHEDDAVHRNLKPANTLFTGEGRAKIADFGLAKAFASDGRMTQTGALMGTPLYISPEQVRGETLDTSSDIYAMGVILYERLAGRPPFTRYSG
jgi:serine/threonine protein kinase